ncbi:MAG: hypothetical protein IT379_22880 [Deltaproteobacteria bacterium]|nr:hypothetical protein [Deltaproteobacteria bacterium]
MVHRSVRVVAGRARRRGADPQAAKPNPERMWTAAMVLGLIAAGHYGGSIALAEALYAGGDDTVRGASGRQRRSSPTCLMGACVYPLEPDTTTSAR